MSLNTSSCPVPMSYGVVDAQNGLSKVSLMDTTPAIATEPAAYLSDQASLDMINSLKSQAYGPCRSLYGPDRSKFYDIHISYDEAKETFRATLVYTQGSKTKPLRKVISDGPVKAVRELVHHLNVDLEALYTENDVGSDLDGQQGYTDKDGNWVTTPLWKVGWVDADDDTRRVDSWVPYNAPKGPRNGKRARTIDDRMMELDKADSLNYGEP